MNNERKTTSKMFWILLVFSLLIVDASNNNISTTNVSSEEMSSSDVSNNDVSSNQVESDNDASIDDVSSNNVSRMDSSSNDVSSTEASSSILPSINTSNVSSNQIIIGMFHSVERPNDKSAEATLLMAAREINENPNILPNYNITAVMMPFSYFGNVGYYIRSFYNRKNLLNGNAKRQNNPINGNRFMAIIGPRNTQHIELLNQILVQSNVLEMSHDAGGDSLTTIEQFPYLINTAHPLSLIERSAVKLLKQMNWMKIGVLFQKDRSYRSLVVISTVRSFQKEAQKAGINIKLLQEISTDYAIADNDEIKRPLTEIKGAKDIRIIVLFVDDDLLRNILCQAYKHGLYGSRYVFLNLFGELSNNWINDHTNGKHFNCSKNDLLTMSKSLLIMSRDTKAADDKITVANKTVAHTWQQIKEEAKRLNGEVYAYPEKILYIYDAIWGFALSLDNIVRRNDSFVSTFSNDETDVSFLDTLSKEYANVDFQGASGWFNFTTTDSKRYRDGGIALLKYEETDNMTDPFRAIGIITKYDVDVNTSAMHFPVPRDGPMVTKNTLKMPKALLITVWLFSAIGMVMSLTFLIINIIWRNVKFLKLSSPNINSIICVGCVFSYTAVICYGLDTETIEKGKIATVCNVTALLLSMGFTLIFGSLFSKTWRIYRIFTKSQAARYVVIKDMHLFSIVMVLLMIDAVIFFTRMFFSPFRLEEQIVNEIRNTEKDIIELDIINRCKCDYQTQIFLAVFIYKGILMLFGLFVAYETRSIKVAAISDSNYIGGAVYNCSLFVTLGSIVVYSLYDSERFKESYIVFALCILQATTVTLCLVFVPKIFMLVTNYDDPNFKNGRPVMGDPNSEYLRSDVHSSTVSDTLNRRWHQKSETNGHYDLKHLKLPPTNN